MVSVLVSFTDVRTRSTPTIASLRCRNGWPRTTSDADSQTSKACEVETGRIGVTRHHDRPANLTQLAPPNVERRRHISAAFARVRNGLR